LSQPNVTRKRRRRRRRYFELKPGTVVFLVLAVIVLLFIANYYRPPAPITIPEEDIYGSEEDLILMPPVVSLGIDDMSKITLSRGDYSFSLEKQGDNWYLVEPFKDLADPDLVAYLVESTAGLRFDEEITEPESLGEYGLDKPILNMKFISNAQETVTLAVGIPEESINWYVKTSESDSIYLLRNLPEFPTQVLAEELISARLVFLDMDNVVSVTARFGDMDKYFEYKQGSWVIADPDLGNTVVFGVAQFMRDLGNLSASQIVSYDLTEDDLKEMGLSPSGQSGTIIVKYSDGSECVVNLGYSTDNGKRYYVSTSDRPYAYLVLQLPVDNLSQKLDYLSNRMLNFDPQRVASLTINPIPQEELDRASSLGQKLPDPPKYDRKDNGDWVLNQRFVFNVMPVVEALTDVPAITKAPKLSNDEYGFYPNKSSFNLEVRLKNKARLNVEFGNQTPDGFYYVQSSDHYGEVYLTTAEVYNTIKSIYESIRSSLIPIKAEQVTAVETTMVTANGVDTRVFTRSGDSWLYNGEAVVANYVTQINTNIINRLASLAAEKVEVIGDEFDPEECGFGLPGSFKVKVFLDDGKEYEVEFGKRYDEGSGWIVTSYNYVRITDLPDYLLSVLNSSAKRITDAVTAIHK
jgi:hypothetical protein